MKILKFFWGKSIISEKFWSNYIILGGRGPPLAPLNLPLRWVDEEEQEAERGRRWLWTCDLQCKTNGRVGLLTVVGLLLHFLNHVGIFVPKKNIWCWAFPKTKHMCIFTLSPNLNRYLCTQIQMPIKNSNAKT